MENVQSQESLRQPFSLKRREFKSTRFCVSATEQNIWWQHLFPALGRAVVQHKMWSIKLNIALNILLLANQCGSMDVLCEFFVNTIESYVHPGSAKNSTLVCVRLPSALVARWNQAQKNCYVISEQWQVIEWKRHVISITWPGQHISVRTMWHPTAIVSLCESQLDETSWKISPTACFVLRCIEKFDGIFFTATAFHQTECCTLFTYQLLCAKSYKEGLPCQWGNETFQRAFLFHYEKPQQMYFCITVITFCITVLILCTIVFIICITVLIFLHRCINYLYHCISFLYHCINFLYRYICQVLESGP